MLQQVLALTVRSLREDVRSLSSHLLRLVFAGYLLFQLVWAQVRFDGSAPGLAVFWQVCYADFALICLGAVSLFASAITEEKEEGTLGLLRMAGIGPASLMLGKSATRLLAAVLILAVQYPFTLLAITLGGVTWNQIVAAYFALGMWLLLAANVGLLASVICSRTSTAAMLTGQALATWLVGTPILLYFARYANVHQGGWLQWPEDVMQMLWQANILGRLNEILASGFSDSPWSWEMATNAVGGAVLFGIACLTFDWFTRNDLLVAPSRWFIPRAIMRAAFRPRTNRPSTPGQSAARPSPFYFPGLSPCPAWSNALIWKDFHFLGGGYVSLVFKTAGYLAIIGMFFMFAMSTSAGMPSLDEIRGVFGGLMIGIGIMGAVIESGLIASRVFWEETRRQTWAALVILPRTLPYLAWSKIGGLSLTLIPAAGCVVMGTVFNLDHFLDALKHAGPRSEVVAVMLVLSAMAAYHVLFLHVTTWLSLWVQWGSLPLAFVVMYVIVFPCTFCSGGALLSGPGSFDTAAGVLMWIIAQMLMWAGSIGLQFAIGHRLARLAQA